MAFFKRWTGRLAHAGFSLGAATYSSLYLCLFHKRVMAVAGLSGWTHVFHLCFKAMTRKIHFTRFALSFVDMADPLSVPWGQSGDGALQPLFKLKMLGWDPAGLKNWPYLSFLFLCGALKRIGMLETLRVLCDEMARSPQPIWQGIAYWQMADIDHLYARWHEQLQQPIAARVFTPPSRIFSSLFMGVDFFGQADWRDRAERHYKEALARLPENGWIWLQLGHFYRGAARYDLAQDAYRRACEWLDTPLTRFYEARLAYFIDGDASGYRERIGALPIDTSLRAAVPVLSSVTTMDDPRLESRIEPRWNELRHTYTARYTYKDHMHIAENTIVFPRASIGRFTQLRNISLSFALVEERYLLKDTNHLPEASHAMFAPRLMDHAGDKATIRLNDPVDQVYCDEPVLMLGGSSGDHYFHFMFEALASLAVIEADDFHPERKIVFTAEPQRFHRELLNMIGVHNQILVMPSETEAGGILYRDVLQLPCASQMTVPHPDAIRFLRRRLARPDAKVRPGKRVHLTRKNSRGVESDQQRAFFEFLRQAGFAIIDPGAMSIAEQRDYFSDVEILSAEGGAACGNLIFCPAETQAIVIAPSTHVFEIWNVLASTLGQTLWMCLEDPAADYPQPFFLWNSMELSVHLPGYAACLTRILQDIEGG